MKTDINVFFLIVVAIFATKVSAIDYTVRVADASIVEQTGCMNFVIDVHPKPTNDVITVNYTTGDKTAVSTGTIALGTLDYTPKIGNINIDSSTPYTGTSDKTSHATVCVNINQDTVYELNENFDFNLTATVNVGNTVLVTTPHAVGTIQNDDLPPAGSVRIAIGDANGHENDTAPLIFTVKLIDANGNRTTLSTPVTMSYATQNISALAGFDYNATSGTLTIPAGSSEANISVSLIDDLIIETNEKFNVNLSNWSSNVLPYDIVGEGTIADNDGNETNYCSRYRGMLTINEYHHMPLYKDIGGIIQQLGNFIELKRDPQHINPFFQPYDNWKIVVYTGTGSSATTFTFAQRDLSCGIETPYLIFSYGSNQLPQNAVNVAVYDENNKEVDFFSLNDPSFKTSDCHDFPFDTTAVEPSANTKDIFRNPDGTGDWTSNGSGANSGATRCWEPASMNFGLLDAVDNDTTPVFNPYNGILRTKISKKNADLKVLSLNASKTGYNPLTDVVVKVFRIDSDGSVSEEIGDVAFNGTSTAVIPNFNRAFAKKDSRILFQYCDVNGTITGHYDDCYANGGIIKSSASFDNFAIRPKEFYNNLTSGVILKAGVGQNIIFQAHDDLDGANSQYNESETNTLPSFVVEANITDATKTCAQPTINFTPRVAFTDGTVTNSYALNNVGDFNVTMHEIAGAEFAHVDVDDTNDTLRTITPFSQHLTVIPDHFGLDGNLTNGSNGFTYLSNFEDYNTSASRNISAGLELNISAQQLNNNVTTNYTSTCYAKDGNITVLIDPFAMTPANAVSKMLWYEKNHDTNGSMAIPIDHFNMPILHTAFDAVDINGTSHVKYLLNFDRNQAKTVDPKLMLVQSVTATDSDAVTGTEVPVINSAYYVYGRIIPRDVRIFGLGAFTANAWYEVFNTTLIGTTALPVSKNDVSWSTNTLHNDGNDGNGDVTVVITGANPANTVAVNGVETYSFGAGYALGGYQAHIQTAPWLWYGSSALGYSDPVNSANLNCLTHPCFNINIVPQMGATGSAKGGAEGNKASKRSDSSGWRSTTDYAPAIR